ncbi:MAG: leucyl aminopeptidase family protein [Bdellovibrionaceae bacterium]|jgi:leucyl aminopeptidase|nr:leucyl aminopeptidase family protein [Pseudobdellovibrionaceae bacterium]
MIRTLKQVEKPWLESFKFNKKNASSKGTGIFSFYFFHKNNLKQNRELKKVLEPWQLQLLKESKKVFEVFQNERGFVHVVRFYLLENRESKLFKTNHRGALKPSRYGLVRDQMGSVVKAQRGLDFNNVVLFDAKSEDIQAMLIGLEIGAYSFKDSGRIKQPQVTMSKEKGQVTKKEILHASAVGTGVNVARHLVNLPTNHLTPKSYAQWARAHFVQFKNMDVEIWNEARLKKENMGLMLAVGQGAKHPPVMVKVSYRPAKKSTPIAFVGKGVTFDTGGLNIKPSSGIRNMKKDMGGSASVMGLAHMVGMTQPKKAMDFYIGICENSISRDAFRPGDIYVGRSGISIEVDNTDAEGRLVLADVLDVAVTQKEKPEYVINVATLTGAIKATLGTDVAGYFSNDDKLSQKMDRALHESAEPCWRMPLYQPHRAKFNSIKADMVNSVNGFGGAMNAALFLEVFVKGVPWIHFDIYAWKDIPTGVLLEPGGNGQLVQALSEFVESS